MGTLKNTKATIPVLAQHNTLISKALEPLALYVQMVISIPKNSYAISAKEALFFAAHKNNP
jgi:hypothetical protein